MTAGREGEAIEEFKLAIAGLGTYEEAYYNLGLVYLKINHQAKACESFKRVVELSPNSEFGVNSNRYLSSVCN
jgi:tetratricopeptide (TPR) repeat protein